MNGHGVSNEDAPRLKRKRSKVRSAWISFVGRIVAQIIGAVASVTLGLVVCTSAFPGAHPTHPTGRHVAGRRPPTRGSQGAACDGELALAVLPIQNYSQDAAHMHTR